MSSVGQFRRSLLRLFRRLAAAQSGTRVVWHSRRLAVALLVSSDSKSSSEQRPQINDRSNNWSLDWRRNAGFLRHHSLHLLAKSTIDEPRELIDRVIRAAASRVDVQRISDREMI